MSQAAGAQGVQRADLAVIALVAGLLVLGAGGQSIWEARDPRIQVWAAWHEVPGVARDPWGNPFQDSEAGIRSAGPNGVFEEPPQPSDDVLVPRVPPEELGAYRLLGWLPWVAAIVLAFGWESLRWLRRPSAGLQAELPITLTAGGVVGVSVWGLLALVAHRERALRELLERIGEGLFVPPSVALGGSAGVCATFVVLAIRLRGAPPLETSGEDS